MYPRKVDKTLSEEEKQLNFLVRRKLPIKVRIMRWVNELQYVRKFRSKRRARNHGQDIR